MQRLSPHLRLLEYLEAYSQLHDYSPAIDEMMAEMGKPRGAIQNSLKYLEREGYIKRQFGKARAIQFLKLNLSVRIEYSIYERSDRGHADPLHPYSDAAFIISLSSLIRAWIWSRYSGRDPNSPIDWRTRKN
jgi:SOS-response transcriptional repressor LexA